jgi:hypothetical protein
MEMQSKPYYLTMDYQTSEQVDIYKQRQSPGEPLPILAPPIEMNNDALSDSKIRTASRELSNGRAGGASGMRAEHVKAWLQGTMEEEDPKGLGTVGTYSPNWCRLSGTRFHPLSAPVDHHSVDPEGRRGLLWDQAA